MLDLNVYIELCGFLVFLVGIGAIYAIFLDPLRWVPGPFSSRFTKVYVIRKAFKGELHTAYRDLHRKYGSVVRVGPNEVIVSDTSAIPKLYGVDNNFAKVGCTATLVTVSRIDIQDSQIYIPPSADSTLSLTDLSKICFPPETVSITNA